MINWTKFKEKFNPILSFLTVFTLIGAFLRFKNLTFQSLWGDELVSVQTVLVGLKNIIARSKYIGDNPPVHNILLFLWTNIFGDNDFSFRALSALAGVGGLVAIYFLGKEIFSKNAGLYASAILSMTTFHIYYSQEARPYSLVCLLGILSYLFLVKQIKAPSIRHSILYILSTALLIYTHYFGLFLVVSQFIFLLFILPGLRIKKSFMKFQIPSFGCLGILYIPWLPTLLRMTQKQEYWTAKPNTDFFINYFRTYLGNESFLIVLFSLLLIIFLIKRPQSNQFVQNKILFLTWIFFVLFIPYFRSFNNPAPLVDRYTILIIPAIILMAASAIESFKEKTVQVFFVSVIVLMFGINLFYTNGNYYEKIVKPQWREAALYVINTDPENKYLVFGTPLFSYYLNSIFDQNIKIQFNELFYDPKGVQKLSQQIKQGEFPGLWVLEGLNFLEKEQHKMLGKKLVRHRYITLERTSATLYVDPRNYTITNQITRVPLGFITTEGTPEEHNDNLIRIKSGNAIILPPLKFSAGSYPLEFELSSIAETDGRQTLQISSSGIEEQTLSLEPDRNMFGLELKFEKPTTSRIKIQFNSQFGGKNSTITFNQVMLHKHESISDFLTSRKNELDTITLIIAAKEDAQNSLTEESRAALVKIGLEKIKNLKFQDSYLAVVENGKVVFEDVGDKKIFFKNARMRLFSGGKLNGDEAQIYIDNIDYSYNNRGLNITVKKGSLIDAYFVDTHEDLRNFIDQSNHIGKQD